MTITLDDRQAIDQLYARAAWTIDHGDAKGWAAAFTPDGCFTSPSYPRCYRGTEELVGFAEEFARSAARAGRAYRHWTNALLLTPCGTDEVEAQGYVMLVKTDMRTGKATIARHVETRDRLVRSASSWLFQERTVMRDQAQGE